MFRDRSQVPLRTESSCRARVVVATAALSLLLPVGTATSATPALRPAAADPAAADPGAFDPAELCPSASPTPVQLSGVLNQVSERGLARSATTGITTRIEAVEDGFGPLVRRVWRHSGDPVSRRTVTTYTERNSDVEQEFLPDQAVYEDLATRRRYTRLLLNTRLTAIQQAAAEEYGKASVWVRTSSSTVGSWPWPGHLDLASAEFAGRIRSDLPGASLSCTVDGHVLTVVASTTYLTRTLKLTVDDDGAPVEVRLTGSPDEFPQWHGTSEYSRPTIKDRSRVITPAQFRTLATRRMVKNLRDGYVTWTLAPKVKAQPTHAKRVAVLRNGLKTLNAEFVKDYNRGTSTGVTSTGKNVTGGRAYTVRCGGAVGKVTFTVKGTKIVTKSVLPPRP